VKLQGLALEFLSGREELVRDGCTYENLYQALLDSFSDKLRDHYHYCNTRLQDGGQGRDESAEDLVIGVGNCVSVQSRRFKMRKYGEY
jgi:hypothetical protein